MPPPGRTRGTRSSTVFPSKLAFAVLLRRIVWRHFGGRHLLLRHLTSQYTRTGVSLFDRARDMLRDESESVRGVIDEICVPETRLGDLGRSGRPRPRTGIGSIAAPLS